MRKSSSTGVSTCKGLTFNGPVVEPLIAMFGYLFYVAGHCFQLKILQALKLHAFIDFQACYLDNANNTRLLRDQLKVNQLVGACQLDAVCSEIYLQTQAS